MLAWRDLTIILVDGSSHKSSLFLSTTTACCHSCLAWSFFIRFWPCPVWFGSNRPVSGSAGGFIADTFLEFGFFGSLLAFAIGWLYGRVWSCSVRSGGLWTVIYIELLAVSIYLPTQSVQAWAYRALIMVAPSWMLWKMIVVARSNRQQMRVWDSMTPPKPQQVGAE